MRIDDATVRGRLELALGDWNTQPGFRDSAVLAILVERDGADSMVFTLRRDDLPDHPGQICWPGGAREGAEDAVTCAVRETCEELGLDPGDFEVLGRLPDRVSIAGYRVAPFVARLEAPRPYTPADAEVADVFEVPCAAFLDPAGWGYTETTHRRARFRKVPFFRFGDRDIWGLTGIMLRDFVTQVMGFAPPVGD